MRKLKSIFIDKKKQYLYMIQKITKQTLYDLEFFKKTINGYIEI